MTRRPVVLLAGGVGGAKLAAGLAARLASRLTVVVNTGDDLERHGLLVCPDHDTVLYTLAGIADREQGWGLAGETFEAAAMLGRLGEETWFRLGDRDLATHLVRTRLLREGRRLTEVAAFLAERLGVRPAILPMTDAPVRTVVRTDDGWLDFQEYFVHRHQAPDVREVSFRGVDSAAASPEVLAAIERAAAIVIGPSNPIVSIGPILAVPGVREALAAARSSGRPILAMSGIVGGRALRGPADRMLLTLGHEPSALGVARLYRDLATTFIVDTADARLAPPIRRLGLRTHVTETVMTDDPSRIRLAAEVLDVAAG